jgi:hypothetical protein
MISDVLEKLLSRCVRSVGNICRLNVILGLILDYINGKRKNRLLIITLGVFQSVI